MTRYGRPTYADGEWDVDKWNRWQNDPAMKKEVDLVLKLEEASRAWTEKYRASTNSKEEYSAQHAIKNGKDKAFNKANSDRIAAIKNNPGEFAEWAEGYNKTMLGSKAMFADEELKEEWLRVVNEGIKAMREDQERLAEWVENTTEGREAFHDKTKSLTRIISLAFLL